MASQIRGATVAWLHIAFDRHRPESLTSLDKVAPRNGTQARSRQSAHRPPQRKGGVLGTASPTLQTAKRFARRRLSIARGRLGPEARTFLGGGRRPTNQGGARQGA